MKTNKIKLGKVSITIDKEPWDINKDYDRLTIVELENAYCTYISRKPVPSGIDIENTEYWMLFSKYTKTYNSNEGVFNMSKYLKLKNEEDNLVKLSLEQAVTNAPLVIKNAGQIITFLDKNNVWQQYQYQSNNITDWNNLLKWKNLNDINTKPIDDETAVIYNISEYIPGGSKYGQVIFPGIYTIYGIRTPVSQYRVIGGYDDSLGEVSFPLQLDETIVIKEIDDSVAIYDTYYLFAGNSIDGYGYQNTLYSGEDTIPEYILKAFGDDSAYVLVNISRLENKINGKLDKKVDKMQGKGLSTNDFTNENVSELANSVVNATYNSNTKKIVFTRNNSQSIELDATPFIKDGMIDDVKIENGYLVITFNTESGKESIRIPLTDIFNPDNYYTKTQTDNLLGNKVNKEQGKGLSSNDYTTEEKNKLANIEEGATANVGTITGITMNGISKGTSGVVDLGNVLTTVATLVEESNQNPVTSNAVYQVLKELELIISSALNDLKESIPENVSDLTNDSGFISSVKTVNGNTITGTGDVSVGTITGITMNNASKGTSGVVNLGTVLTTTTSNVTSGSTTPITSGGVYSALQGYETKLNFTTYSGTSLTLVKNNYYRFTNNPTSLSIALPSSSSAGDQCGFCVTTGSTFSSITFSGSYVLQDGWAIGANTTYEVIALYNGSTWLVTATAFTL